MATQSARPPTGTKALAQGLTILRLLGEAPGPMSATAVAERLGVSVSTASRALGALAAAGYVRKKGYREFTPAIGVLALAGTGRDHFAISETSRADLIERATRTGWLWSLATVHDGQIIYLLRAGPDHEPVEFAIGNYPLHLSVVALRILADLPREEALSVLSTSRRRYGWARPTSGVPEDEAGCLAELPRRMVDGCLILEGWQAVDRTAAAVAATPLDGMPLSLAAVVIGRSDHGALVRELQAAAAGPI